MYKMYKMYKIEIYDENNHLVIPPSANSLPDALRVTEQWEGEGKTYQRKK